MALFSRVYADVRDRYSVMQESIQTGAVTPIAQERRCRGVTMKP
jgi:hypothetical protein